MSFDENKALNILKEGAKNKAKTLAEDIKRDTEEIGRLNSKIARDTISMEAWKKTLANLNNGFSKKSTPDLKLAIYINENGDWICQKCEQIVKFQEIKKHLTEGCDWQTQYMSP